MDDPGHGTTAWRYATGASVQGGDRDQAMLAEPAQIEALLTAATAIGRLSAAPSD